MEEEKLIRRKKKALNGSNRRVLAEACNDLGSFYYKHNRYSDALDEYMSEAGICKELGLRMEWGTCNRKIGEMYMLLAEFDKALKYVEQSLAVAKELKNLVEEQRAMATLGRIYLLQGQTTTTDKDEAKTSLRAAEKAFRESYVLCKNLNGKINKHELMDMRARLLLNIGVLQDHLGNLDKAIDFINKAISICSSQDLYEVLHNCYTTEALLLCNKKKDHAKALSCLNKALEVAKRLDDKVLKTCETLASKADILCEMSDYHSAKQVLFKAWKLKTPDKNESETIEANLRVVAAMCYTEELLTSTDPSDHETFKIHYEKLGDGACHLRNYADAAKYYLKMLDHAELAGECGKMLIPIYVSLYQTYKDMGAYNEALDYYEKEYELIKDVPKEAYTTMYNIAETLYLVKKPYEQIEKACFEARRSAREWNKRKYEVRVLKSLLKYQEEYGEMDKMEQTKDDLRYLGYDNLDNLENSEGEQSSAGGDDEDITHIGDDVCLEDLTDLSDTNEEEVKETKHETCKRGKGYTIKKNMKGETQLHVASISGNKLLVERLIAQGHPVNIRDNAGWLPLHEACIHGHVDVANILINNGANVNDRGGSNCDGITPLYDAASNGHLKVVQLLLEKGAIPTLKTDIGETPLHVLQKWRTGTNLTKDEETIYNNICNKIQNSERNTTDILNRSESKTPVKSIKDIFPPRTSKMTSKIKELDTPGFKRRNIIDDDSDDDFDLSQILNEASCPSDDSNSSDGCKTKDKKKSSDVKEYRNTIEALRNRNGNDLLEVDVKKSEVKPALLDPEEIDDDWLDDDLGINENNNKKRKLDPLTTLAKPSNESINKDKTEEINNISESLIESNKNKSNVNRKSRVSDSDVMQGMNPNIVQAMNVIQPINIVQSSKNGRPVQTQILPLAAVKVQVEDKVLLISLKLDMINRLTISWLVEEVKSRYHKLIGVRPVFSLMTSDGAILSEDDPLSLVLSFPELKTCITNWKASPAEKRYLECCDALGTHFSHHQLDVDCGMSQNEEACLFQASPIRASPRACCPCPVSPPPAPPPLCTAPLSPTPGTSAEVQPEVTEDQDLDEGTLHFLGEAPKTDITMGPSVHKDIANRWQDILTKGLAKDVKEKLFKSYSVPNNCDLLLAPALNPEVKAALQDTLVKIDSALMDKQNQLGIALSALASATDMIISNETSKQKLLKPISDACRILCDSHFWETKTRRNFVISSININLKDALLVTKRGNFLFGENVSEKFKAAKTTQQSGDTLKPKYEKLKGIPKSPNKGHLKYNPQHRKTDNRPNNTRRAACPAFRPPPPPQTSGSSRRYTSPTRSPHRK